MSTSSPNMVELIQAVVRAELRQMHTSRLGTVTAYDATSRRVDVLLACGVPSVDRHDLTVTWSDPPELRGVPVAALGTARSTMHVPLEVGDRVLITTLAHSMDEIVDVDGVLVVEPKDPRQQDLRDSVAIPVDWSSVSSESGESDRHISGEDVRVGDAATAQELALKSDLEDLKDIFSDWVVAANDGGGALKTLLTVGLANWPAGTSHLKGS